MNSKFTMSEMVRAMMLDEKRLGLDLSADGLPQCPICSKAPGIGYNSNPIEDANPYWWIGCCDLMVKFRSPAGQAVNDRLRTLWRYHAAAEIEAQCLLENPNNVLTTAQHCRLCNRGPVITRVKVPVGGRAFKLECQHFHSIHTGAEEVLRYWNTLVRQEIAPESVDRIFNGRVEDMNGEERAVALSIVSGGVARGD